jgi:hypothetical protein
MEGEPLRYTTGEEVQLGDRVQLAGTYATVVVVSNGESYQTAPGYEDYAGMDRGLTICDDDGDVSNVGEADERLLFIDRGTV